MEWGTSRVALIKSLRRWKRHNPHRTSYLPCPRDMPSRKNKPVPKWSMHPELHGDVSLLLAEDDLHLSFHQNDSASQCLKDYDTNIMGRFSCRNETCTASGWSSKKIAITIRLYSGGRYNARVYHQRCQQCNNLSQPWLDDSYGERIAYRLKKWYGVKMERPEYGGKKGKPHHRGLCEGCKAGHCSAM